MEAIRLYDMPPGKVVSSGTGMFGQEKFDRFINWMGQQPPAMFPRDFLFFEQGGLHWVYTWQEGLHVPEDFDIIDFPGGLYAAAADIDQQTDMEALQKAVDAFLAAHGLERDASRPELGSIITSPRAKAILGYEQMDYYTPVQSKE